MIGSIINKNVTEMYRVSWDQKDFRLIIAISDKVLEYIRRKLEEDIPELRNNHKKKFVDTSIFDFAEPQETSSDIKADFEILSSSLLEDFGFGKVLKYLTKDKDGFTKFYVELKNINSLEEKYLRAVSKTFSLLTRIFDNYEYVIVENCYQGLLKETKRGNIKDEDSQILTFATFTDTRNLGGNGICGHVSSHMKQWLISNSENRHITNKIIESMISINSSSNIGNGFSSTIWETGGFVINCPGDACGLNPEGYCGFSLNKDEGFEFGCHNVDSITQQIYLLVGLTVLCDLYREYLSAHSK